MTTPVSDYEDYAKWKGWIGNEPFGTLSNVQRRKFELQLDRCDVKYKGIKALEIGYGNGAFLQFLQDNDSSAEGVEIQPALLDAARSKGWTVHGAVEELIGRKYDLVAGFDVLEHLSVEQLKSLFSMCSQLLTEKGQLFFRFPNADSFMGLSSQNGDYTHITALGESKLQQIVQPLGLEIVRFESALIYPSNRLKDCVRFLFRYAFMKAVGIGRPHFFAGDVVAVLRVVRAAQS